MAKSETIAALDIGTSKVACAFAEFYREGDVRIEVKAHSEIDCREINGAGINFLALGDVVEELFDRMEKDQQMENVVVGLSSEYVGCSLYREHKIAIGGSDIEQEHIDCVLKAAKSIECPENREIIKIVPRTYSVDNNLDIVNPLGMFAYGLGVGAYYCFGATTYIENMKQMLRNAGLSVDADKGKFLIFPSSMASAVAVLGAEEKEREVAVVDIGHGNLDLAIYSGQQIIYSNVLGCGGLNLINDIARQFNVSEDSANNLLLQEGLAGVDCLEDEDRYKALAAELVYGKSTEIIKEELVRTIEARLDEFLKWIEDQFEHVYQNFGVRVASMVLTGGVAQLPKIEVKFNEVLKLPVRIGKPCSLSKLPVGLDKVTSSTVTGLLTCGIDELSFCKNAKKSTTKLSWFWDLLYKIFPSLPKV
ncbi:cell division protein FtsA [bacterium]|nr:cell division protein FtsA [bacterium]